MGQLFLGFFKVPGATPDMGAENWNFLKLLKTMIVGALWFRLGLLSIRILCFFGGVICDQRSKYQ